MSTSVLKRTLELFKEDDISEKCDKRDAKKVKRSKKHVTLGSKQKTSNSTWQTAADIRRRLQSDDRTDDNLRALELLASTSLDRDIASKIMVRAGYKRAEKTVTVPDEKTAFTEEDFEKFEKEYFVSN